ncbi:hypothetical protein, partial [Paenibacillus sp. CGMCC 1.18879]
NQIKQRILADPDIHAVVSRIVHDLGTQAGNLIMSYVLLLLLPIAGYAYMVVIGCYRLFKIIKQEIYKKKENKGINMQKNENVGSI